MLRHRTFLCMVILFCVVPAVDAQPERIDPAGIEGTLLVCGNPEVPDFVFEHFVELAGGAKAKIVIGTFDDEKSPRYVRLAAAAKKIGAPKPRVKSYTNSEGVGEDTTGVWLQRPAMGKKGFIPSLDFVREIQKRRGVLATADYISDNAEGNQDHEYDLKLLPDALIRARSKKGEKSIKLQELKGGVVGYEIDPDAAMLVKGRTISVVGDGTVHIYVGNRELTIRGKQQADLTALRREARDLADGFPPKKPEAPVVEKGTLVIVGGGGLPEGLAKKFVEYAGGDGKACIAIFPTANPDPLPKRDGFAAALRKAGAKKATILYGKTQKEVESPEFLDTLKEATGLWFDGGRQWRFVDCYENTKALPLMFDVLKRGGVIGGSSAGATIQGDYLCRGGVFNNFDIRYPGYERGLGFLKGVAIDQHFTQRKRQPEMTALMKTYPQYLGIGIDETTAIVVKGSTAEVIGKGKVHFYDAKRKAEDGQPDYEALSAGGRYELKDRKVLATGQ